MHTCFNRECDFCSPAPTFSSQTKKGQNNTLSITVISLRWKGNQNNILKNVSLRLVPWWIQLKHEELNISCKERTVWCLQTYNPWHQDIYFSSCLASYHSIHYTNSWPYRLRPHLHHFRTFRLTQICIRCQKSHVYWQQLPDSSICNNQDLNGSLFCSTHLPITA